MSKFTIKYLWLLQLQDLVQIVTNDFKTELREENHWLLIAPVPVKPIDLPSKLFLPLPSSEIDFDVRLLSSLQLITEGNSAAKGPSQTLWYTTRGLRHL